MNEKVRTEFRKLLHEGHAVKLDSTYAYDGQWLSDKVHHYLTCKKCEEVRNGRLRAGRRIRAGTRRIAAH